MTPVHPLAPEQLHKPADLDDFAFGTTAELEDLSEIIGQPRAVQAVLFGTGMQHAGYNIFALGPPGTGKRSLVTKFFKQKADSEAAPDGWCYVYNFAQDDKPKAIRLPAGMGAKFQQDMAQFVDELRNSLSAAFESDEYRSRRQVIEGEVQEKQENEFEILQAEAQKDQLALLRTPTGFVFAPVKEGDVMPPEEFKQLPEDDRRQMEKRVGELQDQLQKMLQKVPGWQREVRQRIRDLNREITSIAVNSLLKELQESYADHPQVVEHLGAVQKDVIENASRFNEAEESPAGAGDQEPIAVLTGRQAAPSPTTRYQVNLLIDHQPSNGAPVIFEENPTYENLIGRVDYMARMGALVTDFTLIKPGSLHKANGGYLILDARKALLQPYVWEALKRAIETRQLRIESAVQMLGILRTTSLEPEPIPLDVKVALLGDPSLYYLLASADPEFPELFKVQADFAERIPRTRENLADYTRLVATLARKEGLHPLDKQAVAHVIEYSARLMSDAERLSIKVNDLADLLREADYWTGENGEEVIRREDIQKAIDARNFRADRIREIYQENILRETINIATQGESIGQINGLSIIQVGAFSFGFPSRITARVRRGKGDVVDIEREVELSGPIHSKGVLILAGFLGERYSSEDPLSLSASLVFEQSYSGVEGDSASSAELYALMSALARVPIKQAYAVTGSVNQHGLVQAIGGVNEKIEGYYDICQARGLTGEQGVLIPQSNVKHLMLKQEILDSVAAGKFSVYPIETIDQGIEILTGVPAGQPDQEGHYALDTINGRVEVRLKALADKARRSSEPDSEKAQ